jgi:dTMP kinase
VPSTSTSAGSDSAATSVTQGLFISFEGIDGAGKSSHVQAVADAFRNHGRVVTVTREPGGTPLAEKLRVLALNDAMDPLTEALLMFAARRDHLLQVIEPALGRGEVVLCDRFTDATFAYQGGGRDFDLNVLAQLERWVQRTPAASLRQPDLTLLFDLDPSIAAQRLAGARVPDKFESQPVEFFARVAAGYHRRVQEQPSRFARIDADQPREGVWNDVLAALRGRGWLA